MTRILVLASTFPRWTDDAVPPFVLNLSNALADRDNEVHVLAPHAKEALRRETMGSVTVHRFRYAPSPAESLAFGGGIVENLRRNKALWALVPPFLTAELIAAIRLIRKYRIEVVHAHWFLPQGLVAALAQMVTRVPFVITGHAADVWASTGFVRKRLLKFAARKATSRTVVTSRLQQDLLRLTGTESEVIPMGVDTDLFQPGRATPEPGSADTPTILFVGRLAEKKGVRHLVQALPRIREHVPNARVVIAGEGPQLEDLRQACKTSNVVPHVDFVGGVSNRDLPAYYCTADIVVCPSIITSTGDSDALPVVLMEAAASGLPMVASDVGGISDVVRDGQNGFLVKPGDEAGLADSIIRVLTDENLSQGMRQRSRSIAEELFSWDRVSVEFDSVIKRSIRGALPATSNS